MPDRREPVSDDPLVQAAAMVAEEPLRRPTAGDLRWSRNPGKPHDQHVDDGDGFCAACSCFCGDGPEIPFPCAYAVPKGSGELEYWKREAHYHLEQEQRHNQARIQLHAAVSSLEDALNAVARDRNRFSDIVNKQTAELAMLRSPIPMVLHCPACGMKHVDKPQPEKGWTNPPHRSHACQNETCGYVWRPADVATVGVAAIATKGKGDSNPYCPECATFGNPPHYHRDTLDGDEIVPR
jgi:hypothetical protein